MLVVGPLRRWNLRQKSSTWVDVSIPGEVDRQTWLDVEMLAYSGKKG